ncbi:MAG: metal ABC transporter substrate-binding protein [Clostridia bacterium]|nr:metal ABC transporter substrate-binding protein [Clostridia bacterium]
MKRVFICILCLVLLCGCGITPKKDASKIKVVTTIFPLYDFARALGGDRAEVKMLIRPGTEVHSFDPLPSDMAAVYDCDLFLFIGGESDTWAKNLINDKKVNSLALINSVDTTHGHTHSHEHSHPDEHIWTSPEMAVKMLDSICESFVKSDPQNAEFYRKNCEQYIGKINTADQKMKAVADKHNNPFIVVADRFPFAYFTHQYGIEYEAAFDGCAVSTDISLKTMSRLTSTIKQKNIKSVFCTEISNKNIANALHNELGVEVIELHSAHNVTLDDFNEGVTYVDILYRNIKALERGLSK